MKCVVKNCLLSPCPGPATCRFRQEPMDVPMDELRKKLLSEDCDKGTVRPFYCGTQSIDWRVRNCDACAKFPDVEPGVFFCELDYCLSYAAIAGGTISQAIAARIGFKPGRHCWDCKEKVAK